MKNYPAITKKEFRELCELSSGPIEVGSVTGARAEAALLTELPAVQKLKSHLTGTPHVSPNSKTILPDEIKLIKTATKGTASRGKLRVFSKSKSPSRQLKATPKRRVSHRKLSKAS